MAKHSLKAQPMDKEAIKKLKKELADKQNKTKIVTK